MYANVNPDSKLLNQILAEHFIPTSVFDGLHSVHARNSVNQMPRRPLHADSASADPTCLHHPNFKSWLAFAVHFENMSTNTYATLQPNEPKDHLCSVTQQTGYTGVRDKSLMPELQHQVELIFKMF